MKLNLDCIRSVLMEFEEFPMGQTFFVASFRKSIQSYGEEEVLYSLLKLAEAGYIEAHFYRNMNGKPFFDTIIDITFYGHEFLADIKPQSNWEKISGAVKQGGSASLKTITNVAIDLGTEALKRKLGLLG